MNGTPLARAALVWHTLWMPKRNKQERPKGVSEWAHHIVSVSTRGEKDSIEPPTKAQVSLLMAELGRKGGKKGGKRRLETMTPEERKAVAIKAAKARWKKR